MTQHQSYDPLEKVFIFWFYKRLMQNSSFYLFMKYLAKGYKYVVEFLPNSVGNTFRDPSVSFELLTAILTRAKNLK